MYTPKGARGRPGCPGDGTVCVEADAQHRASLPAAGGRPGGKIEVTQGTVWWGIQR